MAGLVDHPWKRRFSSSRESLLEGFYKPALMDAVRYWRSTGYFTSRALLQVLDGVEQLVAATPDGRGHGQMRLIAGVFLSRQDVAAIARGALVEQVLGDHLVRTFPFRHVQPGGEDDGALGAELLAWLVDHGHPEIRVALPLHNGQVANDGASFHAKEGIIEDCHGQRLAFTGSVNETPNGWSSNYESFTTFCSWRPGGEEHVDDLEAGFCASGRTGILAPAPSPCPMPSAGSWPFSSPRKGYPGASSSTSRRRHRLNPSPHRFPLPRQTLTSAAALSGITCSMAPPVTCPVASAWGKPPAPSPHGPTSTGPFSGSGKVGRPGC